MNNTNEENKKDNIIRIGKKEFIRYITAVQMHYNDDIFPILITATGSLTSRAIDVALHRSFANILQVENTLIDTIEMQNKDGRNVRISRIEITLNKKRGG